MRYLRFRTTRLGCRLLLTLLFFKDIILHFCCPSRISPKGNSGRFPRRKPAATESRYQTTMHTGIVGVSMIHRTLAWTTGSLTRVCHTRGNGSSGYTKQDLAVQDHQFCEQVQTLQVSWHLHSPLQL